MPSQQLIISVKAARKLLGEDAKQLSDTAIEDLIVRYSAIAKVYIKTVPKT